MLPRHRVGLRRLVLGAGQYGARAPTTTKRHISTLDPALTVRAMLPGTPSESTGHALSPARPGIRARHFIRSLAPPELAAGDWGDLSLLRDKMVTVADEASGKQAALRINYASDGGRPVLFPAGTAGFFYLHVPDSAHPIGAHLRFRLVAAPDPAMFAAGRDLYTPSGAVWARWLPTAARQAGGDELARIAERQGLLPAAAVTHWRAASGGRQINKAHHLPVCPGTAFWWTLSRTSTNLALGWGAHYRMVTLLPGPFARRHGARNVAPFEGRALVKLVESPGQHTYDLHILKVAGLQVPPGYDGPVPVPEKGAIVRLGRAGRRLRALVQEMQAAQPPAEAPESQALPTDV